MPGKRERTKRAATIPVNEENEFAFRNFGAAILLRFFMFVLLWAENALLSWKIYIFQAFVFGVFPPN